MPVCACALEQIPSHVFMQTHAHTHAHSNVRRGPIITYYVRYARGPLVLVCVCVRLNSRSKWFMLMKLKRHTSKHDALGVIIYDIIHARTLFTPRCFYVCVQKCGNVRPSTPIRIRSHQHQQHTPAMGSTHSANLTSAHLPFALLTIVKCRRLARHGECVCACD